MLLSMNSAYDILMNSINQYTPLNMHACVVLISMCFYRVFVQVYVDLNLASQMQEAYQLFRTKVPPKHTHHKYNYTFIVHACKLKPMRINNIVCLHLPCLSVCLFVSLSVIPLSVMPFPSNIFLFFSCELMARNLEAPMTERL
jgi:hypothetical protein